MFYTYHTSPTEPIGNLEDCIFGVELEILNENYETREVLEDLIYDYVLGAPGFENDYIQIEYDGSVYAEIILNADIKENILRRVESLDYHLSHHVINWPYDDYNASCHIHLNREYLRNIGITSTNIYKMVELYAPILYAVSGRNWEGWKRWTPSKVVFNKDLIINWKERVKEIRNLEINFNDRYQTCNLTNEDTIEIRAFSNSDAFNSDKIRFYLEICEFIISECEYMKGKYYTQEYKTLLKDFQKWILRNYEQYYKEFKLNNVFNQINIKVYNKIKHLQTHIKDLQGINHTKTLTYKLIRLEHKLEATSISTIDLTDWSKTLQKIEYSYYKTIQSILIHEARNNNLRGEF